MFLSLGTSFFFIPFANADDAWWAQTNYENDVIYIKAPEGWEFYEVRGWYGSPTDDNCGADVTRLLTDEAKGKTEYTIYANNNTFGDPCGGVYKVFRFTWSIVPVYVEPSPEPTPTESPEVEPSPSPTPPVEPTPEPSPEPTPTDSPEPSPSDEPTPVNTPEPQPSETPTPEPTLEPLPTPVPKPTTPPVEPSKPPVEPVEPPVVVPNPTPEPIVLTEDTQLEDLPADTPILLENGVVLTAQVVIAIQLLENPAELLSAIFTDPSQALLAISNIGADMSPKAREKSEKVVVSAIIAGGIATQAAASAAATSTYRRKP